MISRPLDPRHERALTCQECRTVVIVGEVTMGATTLAGHRWLEPGKYRCGGCMEARQV